MNPQTPSSFQSFADYLGLNEESLRELEASAAERAMQADDAAGNLLGQSYQQAMGDMAAGGEGNLSQQSSYLDYVRARRQADEAAMLPATGMSPAERAARESMREGDDGPQRRNLADLERRFSESLGRDAAGVTASRQAADEYRKRQQAERDEQDRRFKAASAAYDERLNAEEEDLFNYAQGRGSLEGRQFDLLQRYGSVAGARDAIAQQQRNRGRTPWAGKYQAYVDSLNMRPQVGLDPDVANIQRQRRLDKVATGVDSRGRMDGQWVRRAPRTGVVR